MSPTPVHRVEWQSGTPQDVQTGQPAPRISAIIPVHNGDQHLRECLASLASSEVEPFEIIVLDDASSDDSGAIARQFEAYVITLTERRGPAHARNVAALHAKGDILLFLDSDVCVDRFTLGRVAEFFTAYPELDSIIGSYDTAPADPNFISCYKNLLHCYTHQIGKKRAGTFWTGCGAVRRQVFVDLKGFDESYDRSCVEDIEFGLRLVRSGGKIELVKDLQVKHLKRWSLLSLLRSDIFDRAIPWTELILQARALPDDLNLRLSQRVSTVLSSVLLFVCLLEIAKTGDLLLLPLLTILLLCLGRYWMQSVSLGTGKSISLVVLAVFCLITFIAGTRHALLLPILVCTEYLLLYVRDRCLHSAAARRYSGIVIGSYFVGAVCVTLQHLPSHPFTRLFGLVAAGLLLLNAPAYLFLARHWGMLFALAAVPLHWLYHLYCGPAFVAGVLVHKAKRMRVMSVQFWRTRPGAIAKRS